MTNTFRITSLAAAVLLLGACASVPTGPSAMVLPGSGKSFDQFRMDDMDCRQYASLQSGGSTADQAAVDSGLKSAAIGAGVGALAGAAMGGHRSAGTGAGVGLIVGSAAGASAASSSGQTLQQRYDIGYQQCMYAKGHQVPVYGRFDSPRRPAATSYVAPPPQPSTSAVPPPPPPGSPPAPPPGVR